MKILIIDHKSRCTHQLKSLIPDSDVIPYQYFTQGIADMYDAVVLAGGPIMISRDRDLVNEKEFIRTTNKPILGICLGMQIICVANGCKLKDLPYKNEGMFNIDLTPVGFEPMELYYNHGCYIDRVPDGFDGLIIPENETDNSDDIQFNVLQFIKHKTKNIMALQAHPELYSEGGKKIINYWLNSLNEI